MDDHVLDALMGTLSDVDSSDIAGALHALSESGIDIDSLTPREVASLLAHHSPSAELLFGQGGYHGTYEGVPNCWFSSDGKVYSPSGVCIGAY